MREMLTQARADELMAVAKVVTSPSPIHFPDVGQITQMDVESVGGREAFLIDVNRRGTIRLKKCTYQERYAIVEVLLRLDIDGPTHENPDGVEIPTPHLH